jgi:hypothetical protein
MDLLAEGSVPNFDEYQYVKDCYDGEVWRKYFDDGSSVVLNIPMPVNELTIKESFKPADTDC